MSLEESMEQLSQMFEDSGLPEEDFLQLMAAAMWVASNEDKLEHALDFSDNDPQELSQLMSDARDRKDWLGAVLCAYALKRLLEEEPPSPPPSRR